MKLRCLLTVARRVWNEGSTETAVAAAAAAAAAAIFSDLVAFFSLLL